MMNRPGLRMGLSSAMFFGSVLLIRLTMLEQSSNCPSNPAWKLVNGIYLFEVFCILALLVVALVLGIVWLTLHLHEQRQKETAALSEAKKRKAEESKTHFDYAPLLTVPQEMTPQPTPQISSEEKKSPPKATPLSPEELKKKAINQILRGR